MSSNSTTNGSSPSKILLSVEPTQSTSDLRTSSDKEHLHDHNNHVLDYNGDDNNGSYDQVHDGENKITAQTSESDKSRENTGNIHQQGGNSEFDSNGAVCGGFIGKGLGDNSGGDNADNHNGQRIQEEGGSPDVYEKDDREHAVLPFQNRRSSSWSALLPNMIREEPFSFDVDSPDGKDGDTQQHRVHSQLEKIQGGRSQLAIRSTAAAGEDDSQKRSSLEMRRMPVNVLLKQSLPESTSDVSEGLDKDLSQSAGYDDGATLGVENKKGRRQSRRKSRKHTGRDYDCLGKFCLRPELTLRSQMMLTFGSICFITITVVVVICIALTILAGENVRKTATASVKDITYKYRATRARYTAETLDQRLLLFDTVKLIEQATLDRFDGYPDPTDNGVPFKDMITQTNIYPIIGKPMPLDWNVTPNVNERNYNEFVQSRWQSYKNRAIDTTNGAFIIQGSCDPNESDPMSDTYLPNCTESNNDIRAGGTIAPSSMTEILHRKGSDLIPLFRALFESREEIRDIGLAFMNEGAGAFISYPQYALSSQTSYVSIGCDWLLSPNPYDPARTIGSVDMLKRCSDAGETKNSRLYNPMEREWCREMALNPQRILANVWEDAWSPGDWNLVIGKGIYDRRSREFISCIYLGVSLDQVDDILVDSRSGKTSETTVVQFTEFGYVVASSKNITRFTGGGLTSISDAGLGLTKESYAALYELVDYDKEWDPQIVRQAYDEFAPDDGVFFVAAYPLPPIPDEYDPLYRPIFLVVASSSMKVQNEIIDHVNDNVDYRVRQINRFAMIVWAVGVFAASIIICLMAHMLTSPLTQMNHVASEIVNNFGDAQKEDEIKRADDVISSLPPCTPKTELSEVVAEFNVMVASFSGASQAKSQKFKDEELENRFPERKLFMNLYSQRSDPSFKYNPTGRSVIEYEGSNGAGGNESVAYMHFGTNIASNGGPQSGFLDAAASQKRNSIELQHSCSPLFWWIVVLIVLPLFFITILVAAGVITTINSEFDNSTIDTERALISLHEDALEIYVKLRSGLVAGMTEKSIVDLYVATRYVSWLLFGGMIRSDSFTELTTGIEECKSYSPDFSQCEYYKREFVCDCSHMERGYEQLCQTYDEPSRPLATNYWISETSTALNGDRLSTDYPISAFSPATTDWWPNSTSVPGWQSGSPARGYESTYDRLRVISAVPIFQPLFYYGVGNGKEVNLGINVAFEADGLFFGFGGCFSSRHVELVEWKSTEDNNAAKLRPELCPLGKHGYDPRCRGWYDTGRKLSITENSFLHVTAPYRFASAAKDSYAQTATMSLMDPLSGEHIGQTLLDFLATPVYRSLESETFLYSGGFAVLITVEGDSTNTVIGPGVSTDQVSLPVTQSVLRYDAQCRSHNSACRKRFEAFQLIAEDMQRGSSGSTSFERSNENGVVETMYISYAPVSVRSLTPIDSSDYSRGINQTQHLIYSLALVESEDGLLLPFAEIERTTRRQSNIAIGVLSIVIFLAICIIVYISHNLATSFTQPMLYLLGLIQYINKHGVNKDPPTMRQVRASYEIVAFSKTLEALYRIVRSANIAFFAGELEVAYRVLIDALRLFRRLDNKKAIGIACNNIGNTLLAIYREMQSLHEGELYGLTKAEVIKQAIAHYHTAIQVGEQAYDQFYMQQGWSPACLDFMQHLSNRYFNRGLFLLIIKEDHDEPGEIEQLGMRDLQIAGDMDEEVVSYSAEIGWGTDDQSEKRFNINVTRICGYNTLRSIGYMNDWGVEHLIQDTMSIVKAEAERAEKSRLFASVSLAGRLQELEVQLMQRKMLEGDLETAAKIAVRMLIEDEQIFGEAVLKALEVLLCYSSSNFVDDDFRNDAIPALNAYHQLVTDSLQEKRQNARDDLESTFSGSIAKSVSGSIIRHSYGEKVSHRTSSTNNRHSEIELESSRFVTMEDF